MLQWMELEPKKEQMLKEQMPIIDTINLEWEVLKEDNDQEKVENEEEESSKTENVDRNDGGPGMMDLFGQIISIEGALTAISSPIDEKKEPPRNEAM